MSNQQNKNIHDAERRILPFLVEFVKFASGFAAIVAAALITLQVASAAMN